MKPGRAEGLAGLGLAGLVFAAWWGWAGTRDEGGGVWALAGQPVELTSVALAGTMRDDPSAMELGALQAAQAPIPLRAGDRVELDVELLPGGSLLLRKGQGAGVNAPTQKAPLGTAPPGGGRPPGGGPGPGPGGPPPGGGPGPGPGGGGPGGARVDPRVEEARSPGVIVDFGVKAEVRGHGGLVCPSVPLESGHVRVVVTPGTDAVGLEVNGKNVRCTGASITGPWLLRPGVQRVRVNAVHVSRDDEVRLDFTGGGWFTGWAFGVLLTLCGGAAGGAAARRWPSVAGVLAPGMVGPALAAVPLAGLQIGRAHV